MTPPKTLREYYSYYLTLHTNKWTRRFHVIGQLATISFIVLVIKAKLWPFLILSPFIIYPFAWSGHYFFEKNKPAAFSNPLMAKVSDWIMLKDWILGRVER
jgi:hypothetical protein|tara:strand:- start:216 stop:518 length:303 start_codon:yes stop_codon:yes gene_type:complete